MTRSWVTLSDEICVFNETSEWKYSEYFIWSTINNNNGKNGADARCLHSMLMRQLSIWSSQYIPAGQHLNHHQIFVYVDKILSFFPFIEAALWYKILYFTWVLGGQGCGLELIYYWTLILGRIWLLNPRCLLIIRRPK